MIAKFAKIPHYANRRMQSWISSAMTQKYGENKLQLESPVAWTIFQANRLQRLLTEDRYIHLYQVRGEPLQGKGKLNVLFAGDWRTGQVNSLTYFEHLLFRPETTRRKKIGRCPIWQMRGRVEAAAGQVDMVVVRTNSLMVWKPNQGEWVFGPGIIRMVFDYHPDETWDDIVSKRMKSQSHNLSVLRRSGFTYRVSHNDADFSYFYHKLYLPMVQTRYQGFGEIVSEPGIYKVFKDEGFLLLIENEAGEVVSGGLQSANHGVIYALLNGVLDGSQALVRKGALTACYYYGLKWGYENGYRRFDAGVCQPFLTDGVFQHKRFWGYEPLADPWKAFNMLIWAPNNAHNALMWMKANPLLPQFTTLGGTSLRPTYESALAD